VTATQTRPETRATVCRRRGAALEGAILAAAFDELTEVGYTAFSVEAVAARARTGKASIYRRWPTKQQLLLDALCARMPSAEACGFEAVLDDSVTTKQALLNVAQAIATVITSPAGDAMRAIKCEAASDPELARLIDVQFQAPRRAAMLDLLQRGVERGEVRPDAVTPLVADVIPAILAHRVIMMREKLSKHIVTEIIEQIFIPLVEVR
jgi:AcrR family transcriptional regulator